MLVSTDNQGRTTGLSRAGWAKPGQLFLGRQLANGTIILEPARIERITNVS